MTIQSRFDDVSACRRIASFAAGFVEHPLTEAQRHLTYRALLDTFAVAIAGKREAATQIAERYVADLGGGGMATGWTNNRPMPPEAAAWLNGVASHVLDYDDVMTPMRAHVSATLVPSLVALAQTNGADGKRFANAYVAGFEVMAKFARAMALPHYAKGWHSTSALGIIGVTTACGVLLGLSSDEIINALGLAVAQAAGTRENFGTMAKSFQAAQCAAGSVRAVQLARMGFTAAENAIDGRYGFMALYADNEDMARALETLGSASLEIEALGIDVKKYPCCYALHRALDGMLALRAAHGLSAERILRVHVLTSAGGLQALRPGPPRTGLEAKFSMEWAMACAIVDGAIQFSSFTDEAIKRSEMQPLMALVSVAENEGAILPRWARVVVELTNGQVLERMVPVARGDAGDPLSDKELVRKAADCFAYGGDNRDARAFAARVFDMTDRPVTSVVELSA